MPFDNWTIRPPPLIGENIAFSCIFLNKVKLTIFLQPKCGLRPLLLHILDPPLYVATIPKGGGLVPAWKVRDRRFVSCFGIPKNKMFPPCSIVKIEYCGQLTWPRDNVLGRRPTGLNFKSCVWRAVSPHSYHHPQEVLLAQFSLYVNKCGVKPHSFYFITFYKAN